MLLLIYGETVKNLELASFSLENVTPYIQAIIPDASIRGETIFLY